jgi:hypothetical protein
MEPCPPCPATRLFSYFFILVFPLVFKLGRSPRLARPPANLMLQIPCSLLQIPCSLLQIPCLFATDSVFTATDSVLLSTEIATPIVFVARLFYATIKFL